MNVKDKPTHQEVADARDYLLDNLFSDFPFTDAASRAHVVSLLLLPFVRQLISGPTPIHAIDAPSEGTGKSLLMDVCSLIWNGESKARTTPEPRGDDEWAKTILSSLMTNPGYVLIDNISKPINSPDLASALTTGIHTGRLLGQSKMVELPVNCVWIVTGNNIQASREITRRIIRIRLDADCENPNLRTNFKHSKLVKWCSEHRAKLVSSCLTIINGWVGSGMVEGNYTLGSYESWAGVMGGILDYMGVDGFLTNLAKSSEEMNTSDGEFASFVSLWWGIHKDAIVTISDLTNV